MIELRVAIDKIKLTSLNTSMPENLTIRALEAEDLESVKKFADREIGQNYFSMKELTEIFTRSQKNRVMYSLVLQDKIGNIQGIRITYPAGNWSKGKGDGLNIAKWPHPLEQTAYFQSIFVSSALHGQGWGRKLSLASLQLLQQAHCKGVVCHSWKESPHNSSYRYLAKLGFKLIAEHPKYWKDVPYNCTRCGKPPCLCTAQEMYLNFDERNF